MKNVKEFKSFYSNQGNGEKIGTENKEYLDDAQNCSTSWLKAHKPTCKIKDY